MFELGIITAQYCEDESGHIQLFTRSQTTTCTDQEILFIEQSDMSTTNAEQQSTENTTKRVAQFVLIRSFKFSCVIFHRSLTSIRHCLVFSSTIRLRGSDDGHIDYFNDLGNDLVNYEQGQITLSKINPWTLQLCKKHTEKLHRQWLGDENGTVSQSM
jgi:hypothetical protein